MRTTTTARAPATAPRSEDTMQTSRSTRTPALLALLLCALGAAAGCTHENPNSIRLAGNVVALRQATGPGIVGECYPVGTTLLRSHGTLDLMAQNTYEFFGLVRNLMPPTLSASGNGVAQLRADSSTVYVSGAEMSISFDAAGTGPLKNFAPKPSGTWYVPATGTVDSQTNQIIRFPLITSVIGEQLRARFKADPNRYTTMQRVVINVKIEGEMADGTVVQTGTVPYPVDLCWGCLLHLPTAEAGVGLKSPEEQYAVCSLKQIAPNYVPPCVIGNDEFLPCAMYCAKCDLEGTCDDRFCPPS